MLDLSAYIPDGINVLGWTTVRASETIDYQNNATFSNLNEDIKMLYAIIPPISLTFTFNTTGITTTNSIFAILQSGRYVSMVYVQPNATTTLKLANILDGTYTITFKGVSGLNISGLTAVDSSKGRYETTVSGDTSVNVTIS